MENFDQNRGFRGCYRIKKKDVEERITKDILKVVLRNKRSIY